MNIIDHLVVRLIQASDAALLPDVRQRATCALLDYLGCALAGAAGDPKGARLLDALASGSGGVNVIGYSSTAGLLAAALVNGISAHKVELDDGERFGMMHPGAPVFSALLPLAQHHSITGDAFVRGVVAGYEAALCLAGMLQPALKDHGYHATGVCGTIGAAAGSIVALGGTREEVKHALSAAATVASGLLCVIRDRSELKPFNAGQAAMNGLCAALTSRAGFAGPDDALGGKHGLIAMMTGLDAPPGLRQDGWAIERIYVKPYAACRHCHAPIEAALNIRTVIPDFPAGDIEDVHVITHRWAVHLHDHTGIQGVHSAKMSVPYSVAVALKTGRAGLAEFEPAWITDAGTLALAAKVRVTASEEFTALVPGKRAAIVDVRMRDGRCFTERVDLPKGEPECPLTRNELLEKFIGLALHAGRSENQALQIADCVWNIEKRIGDLWPLLV